MSKVEIDKPEAVIVDCLVYFVRSTIKNINT